MGEPSEDFSINATGPYVFKEAVPEQLYRVKANPDYRLGTPGLEEVRVVVAGNPATAALAFEAGEVDMVINYPETDFERIKSTGALGFSAPTARLYFYTVNASSGLMANPLIRKSVSKSIDRSGVVDAVLSGVGGVPAETVSRKEKAGRLIFLCLTILPGLKSFPMASLPFMRHRPVRSQKECAAIIDRAD